MGVWYANKRLSRELFSPVKLLAGAEAGRACHKGAGNAGAIDAGIVVPSIAGAGVAFIHEYLSRPIVAALEVTNGVGLITSSGIARSQIGTHTLARVALVGISLSNWNHDAVVLASRGGRGFDGFDG